MVTDVKTLEIDYRGPGPMKVPVDRLYCSIVSSVDIRI